MVDDSITLSDGAWAATVSPGIGGSLLALACNGEAILRPTPIEAIRNHDVLLTAAYPMIPYANRIAQGRFEFGGVAYGLPATDVGAPHSLHGVGWRRAWTVDDADRRTCTLSLIHRPDIDGAVGWPFAFQAIQRFTVTSQGLALRLELTNLDTADAPAGIGWHPFFRRRAGEAVALRSKGAWLNGPDLLPSTLVISDDWNFMPGQVLDDRGVDNDIEGWDGIAHLRAPSGPDVRLRAGGDLTSLRLYAPTGQDFYAVEPVSHLANAINRPGLTDNAMIVLAPGQSLHGDIEITLDPKP